jgi:hypothetical protein
MSYTLYTTTAAASGLIPQPGRAVNTFPSGLVRVDQTYLGLTANAELNRAFLAVGNDMPDGDSSPCIDGLKIFPEVQEVRREDGFTEYQVCAYGRCNLSGKSVLEFEVNQTKHLVETDVIFALPKTTLSIVTEALEIPPQLLTPADNTDFFRFIGAVDSNFTLTSPAVGYSVIALGAKTFSLSKPGFTVSGYIILRATKVVATTCRNFGSFDEWVMTCAPEVAE